MRDLENSIGEEIGRIRGADFGQLTFDFDESERDQLRRNIEALERRIAEIPQEIEIETEAIQRAMRSPRQGSSRPPSSSWCHREVSREPGGGVSSRRLALARRARR